MRSKRRMGYLVAMSKEAVALLNEPSGSGVSEFPEPVSSVAVTLAFSTLIESAFRVIFEEIAEAEGISPRRVKLAFDFLEVSHYPRYRPLRPDINELTASPSTSRRTPGTSCGSA